MSKLLQERVKELEKQIQRYKEALDNTRYSIHTQLSTMNHKENTELERSYMKGALFASRMMDRYFKKENSINQN